MNRSLLFGICGTAVLLLVILFGPLLAPHNINDLHFYQEFFVNGKKTYQTAPLPSSSYNWLGTDLNGRDLLSKILIGARITLPFAATVALFRVLFAVPLSYLGAIFPRTVGIAVEKISLAFTSVPTFLIVLIVFWMFYFTDAFSPSTLLVLMGFIIAVVGLFPTAYSIQTRTVALLKSPFLEGQLAIGSGKWHILRKHLFPYLYSYIAVLFVTEIAQTLWLITQIGIFKVFIGGTLIVQGTTTMRFPAEWAGSIGDEFYGFKSHPMILFYPAMALAFAILSFNQLADGIRQWQERKWGIGA